MQREMKDSGIEWVGVIPSDWDVSTIKREYVFQTGWTPDTTQEKYFIGENIWVTISDMKSKVVYDSEKHISDEAVQLASMNISPKGSLLYAFKLSVGAVSFCGDDVYTNEAIATFLLGKNSLRFLYYVAPIFIIKNANENIYGAKLLNQKLIRNAKIVVPPYIEQHRIADYLDRKCGQIDAIIARQQEVIEKLKTYKRSVITETVTKGLNPNAPMKDSDIEWIGKIPADWTVVPLKRVATFSKGLPITKDDLTEHGVPVVSYGQIHSKSNSGTHLQDALIRFVSETYFESNPSSLGRKGDIFFADTSEDYVGIGNAVLVDRDTPVFAGYHTIIVRPEEQSYSRYFAYLFLTDTWRSQLCSRASGIKVFSITQGLLKKTTVMLPPVENVSAMTDYLDRICERIDAAVIRKQALIEKLKAYKKSLIYEVVTGKKEVSNLCGLRGVASEGLTGGLNPPLQTRGAHVAPRIEH